MTTNLWSLWYKGRVEGMGLALSSKFLGLSPGEMMGNRLGKFT